MNAVHGTWPLLAVAVNKIMTGLEFFLEQVAHHCCGLVHLVLKQGSLVCIWIRHSIVPLPP